MVFNYEQLQGVIKSGQPIKINAKTSIEKLDFQPIDAVKLVSEQNHTTQYYAFLEINPGRGLVFSSDGNSFNGYNVFEIPLSEFYFDINEKTGSVDINNGVGDETDFLDLITGPAVGNLTRSYYKADDIKLMKSSEYELVNHYISEYLGFSEQDEVKIDLAFLRFVMAIYQDQNQLYASK